MLGYEVPRPKEEGQTGVVALVQMSVIPEAAAGVVLGPVWHRGIDEHMVRPVVGVEIEAVVVVAVVAEWERWMRPRAMESSSTHRESESHTVEGHRRAATRQQADQ